MLNNKIWNEKLIKYMFYSFLQKNKNLILFRLIYLQIDVTFIGFCAVFVQVFYVYRMEKNDDFNLMQLKSSIKFFTSIMHLIISVYLKSSVVIF